MIPYILSLCISTRLNLMTNRPANFIRLKIRIWEIGHWFPKIFY